MQRQRLSRTILSVLALRGIWFKLTTQDATRLRLKGLRVELQHLDSELNKLSPELVQKRRAVTLAVDRAASLSAVVDKADDETFSAFCKKIKVADIREYEDVQLRLAKEENEALESFTTQQARIRHQ